MSGPRACTDDSSTVSLRLPARAGEQKQGTAAGTRSALQASKTMANSLPWSVKGVDPRTRDAAKAAARRAGMTLGEWLDTKIRIEAESGMPEPEQPE